MRCDRRQLKVHGALRLDLSQPIAEGEFEMQAAERDFSVSLKKKFKIFHLLGNDFRCIICDIFTFRCLKNDSPFVIWIVELCS